jgi:prepilin-type N-terminal cleavage/methylation domain-containing protein
MNKKGFTLLELLIVIIIIGILASIALPQYTSTIEKARSGEAVINIGSIRVALDRYWYQNSALPANNNFLALDIDDPNIIVNKLYTYTFTNDGTTGVTRKYTVIATRTVGSASYWIKWQQLDNITGKLTRSLNLGGPAS